MLRIAENVSQGRPRSRTARSLETRAGWQFASLWLAGLCIFTLFPVAATIGLSFTQYSVSGVPQLVGFRNYSELYDDPAFRVSAYNTVLFVAVSVPLKLVLALALASLLSIAGRSSAIYRTIFYLPTLVPTVAGSILFMLLLTPGAGPVNVILQSIGLSPPDWLKDPHAAFWALVLISLWPLGIETLTFLSALKNIPSDIRDAARLDSSRPWHTFVFVTLPLLTPVILFNMVIGLLASFQIFTQALVIGGTTGRPLESTLMLMVVIYRTAFRYFNLGYAAALSTVLFLAILLITAAIFFSSRFWVFYEGEER